MGTTEFSGNGAFIQRQVSFSEAVERAFNNYANFNGRASRSEFWYWFLFTFLVGFAAGIIDGIIGSQVGYLGAIVSLAFFIPGLAITWRRLHDIGRAGGWFFLCFVPLVGAIILLVWYCTASQPMANRFGEVPNTVEL